MDAAVSPTPVDHPDRTVERLAGGGMRIEAASGEAIRIEPTDGGWAVDGPDEVRAWRLVRGSERGERFRLETAGGREELGRTTVLDESDPEPSSRFLLAGDGRMFRLVLRGPADPRFELLGWETPGAYLIARAKGEGFVIEPSAAASGLREIRHLLVLLAAEILESE